MKNVEIVIDGKTYQAQISEEQVQEITAPKVRTGYERVDKKEFYYCSGIKNIAIQDYRLYSSYLKAGFTEEQAWALLIIYKHN